MTTLILEAYAKSEYGDGPAWARVDLTPEFVSQVKRLSKLCTDNKLRAVTTFDAPDAWDAEDELRLRGDGLEVHGDSFWFTSSPKHSDYEVETRSMLVLDLEKALAGESNGESIVEGDIVFQNRTVKEAYTEWLADQNTGEDA